MLRRRFRATEDRADQGFTLIELMVVVLILGVLIAIALPIFLGARTRAQDRSAQSSLRTALLTAKVVYTDSESYLDADEATMALVESSLTFLDLTTDSTGPLEVSVWGSGTGHWAAAALSDSGNCFGIHEELPFGTTYASKIPGDCDAQNADMNGVWGPSW